MSAAKRIIHLALMLEVAAFAWFAALMVDIALHRRDDPFAINQFGYRGPARAAKRPGERRVVIVGGSAAFDAVVPWSSTLGPALVSAMNKLKGVPDDAPFADVQNIAEPLNGADWYVPALKAYRYLEPDVVAVYDGYDAIGNPARGRRESWVFRSTGYFPLLIGPGSRRPDARPDIAPALTQGSSHAGEPSCAATFRDYCLAMVETVRFARAQGRAVLVVTPPYVSVRHRLQQQSLTAEFARQFDGDARFRQVNLGEVIDLRDPAQSPDGVYTTHAANHVIAQTLAGSIVGLLEQQ